jgi:hypothetical protein
VGVAAAVRASAAVRVLLVSTYELGHQPLLLAGPAGFLREDGHQVRTCDLSVEELDDAVLDWAQVVAVAVPMHTATRLARGVVERARRRRGDAVRIVLYGLYAPHGESSMPPGGVDAAIGGEFEAELASFVAGAPTVRPVVLDRLRFVAPDRRGLPPLSRYARLLWRGEERLAGYVESTRGCVHRCRHCPVPVVYDGRIRVMPRALVVADAVRQWEMGARHLTVGDPDFLNAVPHALAVARDLHAALPDLTFDITTKIEHIVRHRQVFAELAALGCIFVVSAVESTDATVLRILDKGHTHADTLTALGVLRAHGLELRPSLLPFTPWSGLGSYLELLDFVAACDLTESVDPVQLSIRLLLPAGSLLLEHPEMLPHLTATSDASGYRWRHPDPAVDRLAAAVAELVASAADSAEPPRITHRRIRGLAAAAAAKAGIDWRAAPPPPASRGSAGWERPRLSEPWFCCAEPTGAQLGAALL